MPSFNAAVACRTMDIACDEMLTKLGANDESEVILISHWQGGTKPGFRIQMTSKSSGRCVTRFAGADGKVSA